MTSSPCAMSFSTRQWCCTVVAASSPTRSGFLRWPTRGAALVVMMTRRHTSASSPSSRPPCEATGALLALPASTSYLNVVTGPPLAGSALERRSRARVRHAHRAQDPWWHNCTIQGSGWNGKKRMRMQKSRQKCRAYTPPGSNRQHRMLGICIRLALPMHASARAQLSSFQWHLGTLAHTDTP